jgi:hypothetical protein
MRSESRKNGKKRKSKKMGGNGKPQWTVRLILELRSVMMNEYCYDEEELSDLYIVALRSSAEDPVYNAQPNLASFRTAK